MGVAPRGAGVVGHDLQSPRTGEDEVGAAIAVDVGEEHLRAVVGAHPRGVRHEDRRAEAAVAEVGPVGHVPRADAHEVGQPVTGEVTETDGGVGEVGWGDVGERAGAGGQLDGAGRAPPRGAAVAPPDDRAPELPEGVDPAVAVEIGEPGRGAEVRRRRGARIGDVGLPALRRSPGGVPARDGGSHPDEQVDGPVAVDVDDGQPVVAHARDPDRHPVDAVRCLEVARRRRRPVPGGAGADPEDTGERSTVERGEQGVGVGERRGRAHRVGVAEPGVPRRGVGRGVGEALRGAHEVARAVGGGAVVRQLHRREQGGPREGCLLVAEGPAAHRGGAAVDGEGERAAALPGQPQPAGPAVAQDVRAVLVGEAQRVHRPGHLGEVRGAVGHGPRPGDGVAAGVEDALGQPLHDPLRVPGLGDPSGGGEAELDRRPVALVDGPAVTGALVAVEGRLLAGAPLPGRDLDDLHAVGEVAGGELVVGRRVGGRDAEVEPALHGAHGQAPAQPEGPVARVLAVGEVDLDDLPGDALRHRDRDRVGGLSGVEVEGEGLAEPRRVAGARRRADGLLGRRLVAHAVTAR